MQNYAENWVRNPNSPIMIWCWATKCITTPKNIIQVMDFQTNMSRVHAVICSRQELLNGIVFQTPHQSAIPSTSLGGHITNIVLHSGQHKEDINCRLAFPAVSWPTPLAHLQSHWPAQKVLTNAFLRFGTKKLYNYRGTGIQTWFPSWKPRPTIIPLQVRPPSPHTHNAAVS